MSRAISKDFDVKVTNPRVTIIAGRSNNLNEQERRDFDFYRRGLKSVVDLATYDELLERLDNTIAGLSHNTSPQQ